ncbi:MAG TPA: ATP-binding protein [Lacisediminihabitans sp.]|uniref:sensor histidine kinase n=1 Tax=Lacisediminihabitans sp. TaxID=2787631 RepID=UPI002ED7DE25
MDAWLHGNAESLAMALAGASAILLVVVVILLVLWLRAARGRRRERLARTEAERERLEVQISMQEQLGRLRIVRELHEVAVHSISLVISQAEGARYAAGADPAAAARSASAIADTARTTRADLRRVMRIVQDGKAEAFELPQLTTVADLIEVMRESGLAINFVEAGERFELKEGAELAIIRIVQEALDNALRYGGEGTNVTVSFTWTASGLQVLVDDDGVRSEARRQGLDPNQVAQQRTYTFEDDLNALTQVVVGPGITEMRERAGLFGGILKAYSVPGVGFSVSAVFPALRYDNGVHGVNLETTSPAE